MRYFTALVSIAALAGAAKCAAPKAHTVNGTYIGKHLSTWEQDAFLGIPFAKPPLGELRFHHPLPIDASFDGERNATEYGHSCMQYGQTFRLSEDCLTINVVRPAGIPEDEPLPVLYVHQPTPSNKLEKLTITASGSTAAASTQEAPPIPSTTSPASSKSARTWASPSSA